ncbi:hypothetical protein [Escherichia coli]|uniref:hypothetical protein n=1 Tax=Escherichia coli TaxID=562 RepID=UPI00388CFF2E
MNLINGSGKPVSGHHRTPRAGPDTGQYPLPDGVETYGVWILLPSLRRRLFRCVSIRENTDGTFAITAVQHVPKKKPSWITVPALSRSQVPEQRHPTGSAAPDGGGERS